MFSAVRRPATEARQLKFHEFRRIDISLHSRNKSVEIDNDTLFACIANCGDIFNHEAYWHAIFSTPTGWNMVDYFYN